MNRLQSKLTELKNTNKKGLFIYLTAGVNDFDMTLEAIKIAEKEGVDVIEIGIPFSDPIADGPIIQQAAQIAIKNGASITNVLEFVKKVRTVTQIPLVCMGYINNVLTYGVEKFVLAAKSAGLDGAIIPDLPYEEAGNMLDICKKNDFSLINFVTPNTTAQRINETCKNADGFIYCVSVNGVTGVREIDYTPINEVVKIVKQQTQTPVAIGFGIGTPAAAKAASSVADNIIVGSAVMQKLMAEGLTAYGELIKTIRQALDEGSQV